MAGRPHKPRARLRTTLQPYAADAFLSACLIGIEVMTGLVASNRDIAGRAPPTSWWSWLLLSIPPLAVTFRTRAPLIATVVATVVQIAVWTLGLASVFAAPLVMIYSSAATGSLKGRRVAMGAVVGLSATAILGWRVAPDVSVDLAALTIFSCAVTYSLGTSAASKRQEAASLAADLAEARHERDTALERATTRERQRIARDLHDLVGHSLSVIVVRAEAGVRVAANKPEAATDALIAIGDTARSSLTEVRRVLFALRHTDEASELAPLPGIGDIGDLVAGAADSAGIDATCRIVGADWAGRSPTVAAGAYRIVQESLTNVIKHAGPKVSVAVDVAANEQELVLKIDDNGSGLAASGIGQGGSGLVGMTERAEVLGGSLAAGPLTGGGFSVRAVLPLADRATS